MLLFFGDIITVTMPVFTTFGVTDTTINNDIIGSIHRNTLNFNDTAIVTAVIGTNNVNNIVFINTDTTNVWICICTCTNPIISRNIGSINADINTIRNVFNTVASNSGNSITEKANTYVIIVNILRLTNRPLPPGCSHVRNM
eukprot:Rmarinus@m.6405